MNLRELEHVKAGVYQETQEGKIKREAGRYTLNETPLEPSGLLCIIQLRGYEADWRWSPKDSRQAICFSPSSESFPEPYFRPFEQHFRPFEQVQPNAMLSSFFLDLLEYHPFSNDA